MGEGDPHLANRVHICADLVNVYMIITIFLKEIRTVSGGRDLVAQLIRMYPKSNFEGFQLSLAAGIGALHGALIRSRTTGQFPVVSFPL